MMFWHRKPRIHLYTTGWNEARILPFFFRHYGPWVERFVVHDNGSNDKSRARLHKHPTVEVRDFPWSDPESFVRSQLFDVSTNETLYLGYRNLPRS